MKAIVTVGLGFGDEGKGATVDFLARRMNADLVVRYCGGAQAGHNVQLPDGRRHTFSQFGAGTLAGVRTYVASPVIICPSTMVPEADHLRWLGVKDPWSKLSVHPDCLVSTTYHALMNRLRESARGDQRHGSCGLGIGETRHYWLRCGQDAIFAQDLSDRDVLRAKLSLLRDRFLLEMQELPRLDRDLSTSFHRWLATDETNVLQQAAAKITLSGKMPEFETAIFEGAQGVLLDEWKGFHPYTTWSTVTPKHALEILAEFPGTDITVLGITRAYATRHGAGPFPSFCAKMTTHMRDPGNPGNDWQGAIRFGPLDRVLLEYAARVAKIDGMFVNALDQLPRHPRLVRCYEDRDRLPEPQSLRQQQRLTSLLDASTPVVTETTQQGILASLAEIAPIFGTSYGASHVDRQLAQSPSLGAHHKHDDRSYATLCLDTRNNRVVVPEAMRRSM